MSSYLEEFSRSEVQFQRLRDWQAGVQPPPGPVSLTLFPTNICNIECKHCWQRWGSFDKSYKSEMSDERLLALVDEAAALGVQSWYFVGGGDPMGRHKLVIDMARKIRALGMNGGIHTNGTLFKPHYIEELVAIGWDQIRVSLDGPTAEINDFIRSRGFDKATNNIRLFSEEKRKLGVTRPHLAIYNTVTNLTFDKIDQFVELAHSLGPDVACELSGLIVEEEGSRQFELNAEQKRAFPDHVRRGLDRARELGVSNNFESYLNEELVLDGMDMHRDFVNSMSGGIVPAMCYEPYISMSIMPDGAMGPCCAFHDPAALSVKERSLAEVWNGDYMNGVRAGMLNGNPPAYCRRCPANLYVFKEKYRAEYAPYLREAYTHDVWSQLSLPRRAAYMASRGARSLREVGLSGTLNRTRRWLKVIR
jgi:MoaA/NifB/PqqE/SkfB family radical SAM enzyme